MKLWQRFIAPFFIVLTVAAFFWQTIFSGKLPVPTDALVGMYHPWRDFLAQEYPRGLPFKNSLITDPVRQQIVWRKQSIDAWKSGHIPSWNALSFSGTTLAGNIQAGGFYPLNIIFFLFSFPVAWTILVISQPMLASLFLYFFLRNKNIGIIPSAIGAVCFAFGGYATSWLTWGTLGSTFLWVPLILLSADKIHTGGKKWPWRMVFLFSLASSFFAGHIQLFFYGLCIVFWYSWWQYQKNNKIRFFPWHILSMLLFILITSPQWLPLMKFLPQTSRGLEGADFLEEGFFIPVKHLIQFIVPDYFGNPATGNYWGVWNYGEMVGYIGVVGIVLAFIGISKATLVWSIPLIIALVGAVQSPISEFPYRFSFPFFSIFQPTRMLAVVSLSLSIIAAYGAEAIVRLSRRKLVIMVGVMAVLFFVIWGSAYLPNIFGITSLNAAITKRNLYLPTGIFFAAVMVLGGIIVSRKQSALTRLFLICLFCLSTFDLFRFGWKFTPFTDLSLFYPQTLTMKFLKSQQEPFRIMTADDRIFPPNTLGYFGLESPGGYDPVISRRYEEFMAAFERGKPDISPPFGFNRIISPKNITSPLLPLLNAKYIVSLHELYDQLFIKVFEEGETKIYEYQNALPRVYFADNVVVKKEKQDIFDEMFQQVAVSPRLAVVESDSLPSFGNNGESSVSVTSYTSNAMLLDTVSGGDRFLVIANSFDRGWKAEIDGSSAILYRTNYIYMGLVVPKGTHRVSIYYE